MEALETGHIIADRYRVVSFLAKGGMGAVYEVEHVHTGEHLALKLLFADLDEEARSRFKREASVAARIKSEHVVRVIDAGVHDGAAFLVMDLLDGADLETTCGSTPQSPEQVVAWLRDVAQGLSRAHELGLVHRDLKPQNLFLTKRPDGSPLVKILDFGIVKHQDIEATPTLTGRMLGTPMYMAPEQAHIGELPITKSADLYSLGLVAFRLLSGANYRRGDNLMKVLAEVLAATIVPPSERGLSLGGDFDHWFSKACAAAPAERFESAIVQVESLAELFGIPASFALPTTSPPSEPAPPIKSLPTNDTFTSAPTAVMDAQPRTTRARAPFVIAALVVLAGVALGLSLRSSPIPSVPVVASAAAAPLPTGIADAPASETHSDAARAHFREGMRRFSLAMPKARESFDAALKADPDFASAHVQRAILTLTSALTFESEWWPPDADEPRFDVRSAREGSNRLPPRDQGLLDIAEQMVRDPAELGEAKRLARDLATRFPDDAEVALMGALVERSLFHDIETIALGERSAALDPKSTIGLWAAALSQADPLVSPLDIAATTRDAAACLKRDPRSVSCRVPMMILDSYEGKCEDLERAGREVTATDPDDPTGYSWRADALAGRNGSITAIGDLLAKAGARTSTRRAFMERYYEYLILGYGGDLEGARRVARKATLDAAEDEEPFWADREIFMAAEMGDAHGAGEVAHHFLELEAARPASSNVLEDDKIGFWLRTAYEGKQLTLAQFRERRSKWMSSWDSRLEERTRLRNKRYALYASTSMLVATIAPEEAAETLRQLERTSGDAEVRSGIAGTLGAMLLAVGRVDDALVQLEPVERQCTLLITHQMRPTLDLGRARALKGDRAGACKAFEKVLLRWGHAKPRSVTAEKARAEAAKLGCEAVP